MNRQCSLVEQPEILGEALLSRWQNVAIWIHAILLVLTVDRTRFRLEGRFRIGQIHKAIALDLHDLFQILGTDTEVVGGQIVGGVGVRIGTDPGRDLVIGILGEFFRSAKHHVFEEVGEAGMSGFVLVPGTGPDDRPVGDEAFRFHRNQQHLEPVFKGLFMDLVGKHTG